MEGLDARLDALAARLAAALGRAQAWVEPLATLGPASAPPALAQAAVAADDDALAELRVRAEQAEASANLQAMRCVALEDRVAELEAALVGAREHRARAEALAESSKREADRALDELEHLRSSAGQQVGVGDPLHNSFGEALQEKLLEIERLTRERDSLRSTTEELRGHNRVLRRERDEATLTVERSTSQLEELRTRDAANRSKLADLERIVGEQRRELELAERRAAHLRQHLGVR